MANLNEHDLILFKSNEFVGFDKYLETEYGFKIISSEYPTYISFTSRKAILHTSLGDLFLKEKPQYSSDQLSLDRSTYFQEFVSLKTDIVPKIIRTKENKFFVEWKGRLYFLTEYKKGRSYNGSLQDVEAMLYALQIMQKNGINFCTNKNIPDKVLDDIESFEIYKIIYLIEKYARNTAEQNLYNRIIRDLEKLKQEYLGLPKNKYVMSHSDFIVFNMVFDNNKVVAVNDFDNVKRLPILHDLAEFLVSTTILNYAGTVTNLKKPILLKPDNRKLNIIIKSYIEDFKLNKEDFKLLANLSETIWLWTLCLSVLKEDYQISDLKNAIACIEKRNLQKTIINLADKLFLE